ncbi:hypothetical protein COY07_05760 [Candidatus Peregrinibacteria bacterium CG_4_10_14_0_2_um_filter_43_11]|nr:MAG: hypothetical protein COY07_05760 [Candidatus Peregrinibacteria bacterium CG_4_10_14_0_2_um_filter_43_11]
MTKRLKITLGIVGVVLIASTLAYLPNLRPDALTGSVARSRTVKTTAPVATSGQIEVSMTSPSESPLSNGNEYLLRFDVKNTTDHPIMLQTFNAELLLEGDVNVNNLQLAPSDNPFEESAQIILLRETSIGNKTFLRFGGTALGSNETLSLGLRGDITGANMTGDAVKTALISVTSSGNKVDGLPISSHKTY